MKTAYITLDLINEIVSKEGKINFSAKNVEKYNIIGKSNQAIQAARKAGIHVGHVKVGFSKDYIEVPPYSPMFNKAKEEKALQLGTWGCEFHADLKVEDSDFIIVKSRINPVYQTNMLNFLQGLQIQHVVISGVSTNFVVNSSTILLHDLGYKVTVLSDACAAGDESVHATLLETFKALADVKTVEEWIESLAK